MSDRNMSVRSFIEGILRVVNFASASCPSFSGSRSVAQIVACAALLQSEVKVKTAAIVHCFSVRFPLLWLIFTF